MLHSPQTITSSLTGWTRGSGPKLKHRSLCLSISKQVVTERVMQHGHRLPRKVVKSLSFGILKSHQDAVWGNWLQMVLLEQEGWTRCFLGDLSNFNHAVIPWFSPPSHWSPSGAFLKAPQATESSGSICRMRGKGENETLSQNKQ